MRLKLRLAGSALTALLAVSTVGLAQDPFADAPAPPVEEGAPFSAAPIADNPFAAAPAPEAPAAPAPPAGDPAALSPFGIIPAAPGTEATEPAVASPFADTTGAAPASPFADTTGATDLASPFGGFSDTAGTDVSVPTQYDPLVYWYSLDYPSVDESTLSVTTGQPGSPDQGQPVLDIETATAIREEIPYSEYKRRYNERVQIIQIAYQNANEQNWQQMGWDPRAMAEWKVYYEQLEAWKKYVEDTVLDARVSGSVNDIEFNTLDQAGIEDAAQNLVNSVQEAAEKATQDLHAMVVAMVERLDERRNRRINYDDWRAEQQAVFLDFTDRWIKQMQGEEINIDGNLYLISDKPIQNAPRDVLPVVTTNLTPYDIFNDDGTLKRPQ